MREDNEKLIEEIVANVDHLPEIPSVALQVNRLMDYPNMHSQGLAEVIMLDPALSSKVLKLCNSAEYGFSRRISTISEAVSILGFNEIKRILFTIITHGFVHRRVQGYALERGELWANAVTCAVYAKYLAQKVQFKDLELAFLAALLRDIGKIALEMHVSGQGTSLEQLALTKKCSFDQAEREIIGINHTELGERMAIRWNLPESLCRVIRYHHKPSQLPEDTTPEVVNLVCIVHLADIFTMMAGAGLGIDGLMYPLDFYVFDHLPIDSSEGTLERLYVDLLRLEERISKMTGIFSSMPTKGA